MACRMLPKGRLCWWASLLLALLLYGMPASAFFFIHPILQHEIRTGYVMSRAQVVGPGGGPLLIVEESTGDGSKAKTREVRLIGEVVPGGALDGFYVLSGADVLYYQKRYAQLSQEHGEALIKRALWLDREQLEAGITLTNGGTVSLPLPDSVKQVLVMGERDRFGADPSGWILMATPFRYTDLGPLDLSVNSVLFDRHGKKLDSTTGSQSGSSYQVQSFTYRSAYFGDGPDAQEQATNKSRPDYDDKVFGALPGQILTLYEPSMPKAVTNDRGLYVVSWIMPCAYPMLFDFALHLDFYNRVYSPMGAMHYPQTISSSISAFCAGVLQVGPAVVDLGSLTSAATITGPNYYLDVLLMAGKVYFADHQGKVMTIGDELTYDSTVPDFPKGHYDYDYDGDGALDHWVLANKKTVKDEKTGSSYVVADKTVDADSAEWVAVYFSSTGRSPDSDDLAKQQPDLWRVPDLKPNTQPAGLLSKISKQAAINTDIYIFRESTGELIVEVSGLPEAGERRIVDNDRAYTWNTMIRGRRSQVKRGGYSEVVATADSMCARMEKCRESFEEGNKKLGFSSRFMDRDSGVPGPGERVRIVAINRTTGYVGSATMTLGSPATGENVLYTGSVLQNVPAIVLRPPNLKVWAKRLSEIDKGITAGEKAEYLISHEGAATRDDTLVAVFTEWLDERGRPLPDGLAINSGKDFGLTGRLAKLSGDQLVTVSAGKAADPDNLDLESMAQGSAVAEFAIRPGRAAQLLRLKSDNLSNEHYYVNVFGRALNKEACPHCQYDSSGANEGALANRPNHYTPVYVPRYDEGQTKTMQLDRAEQQRKEESDDSGSDDAEELGKVLPQYDWVLRPEYQFSLMDFKPKAIQAVTEKDGVEVTRDLLDDEFPLAGTSDDLLRIMYSLVLPESEPLPGFDGTREYVLAVGEQEVRIKVGSDNKIDIDNLEHITQLKVEDFLTARLYLNHDPENLLWQWAFWYLDVGIDDDSIIEGPNHVLVSADKAAVPIKAVLIGYSKVSEDKKRKRPEFVDWHVVKGLATVTPFRTPLSETGQTETTLTLDPRAGNTVVLEARLASSGELGSKENANRTVDIVVIPGAPKYMTLFVSGQSYLRGIGDTVVEALVRDRHGNNVTDGTGVHFKEYGHITVESYEGLTKKGVVKAKIKGGATVGSYRLLASSGEAEASKNIDILPLSVTIANLPDRMHPGEQYDLVAQLGGSRESLAGVFLDIGSDRGQIIDRDRLTDATGQVSFRYLAPREVGTHHLAIRLDANNPTIFPITVAKSGVADNRESQSINFVAGLGDKTYLTANAPISGIVNVPLGDDAASRITGVAGSPVNAALEDFHWVNRDPVLLYRFSSPATDERRLTNATFSGLRQVSTDYPDLQGFYFSDEAHWQLENSTELSLIEPAFDFLYKADRPGHILSIGREDLTVVDDGGRVIATLRTGDSVTSVALPSPVVGSWVALGVGIKGRKLYLAIDDAIAFSPLSDSYISFKDSALREESMRLGGGFAGAIGGLRVYDWSSPPLLSVATATSVFDSDGYADIGLTLTEHAKGNSLAHSVVTVGLIVSGERLTTNVFSANALEAVAGSYVDALASGGTTIAQMLDDLLGIPVFPELGSASAGMSRRFTMMAASDSSRENVVANLSWYFSQPKYRSLISRMAVMQKFFAEHSHTDLSVYAVEYLQEAVVLADDGYDLWTSTMITGLTVWAELVEHRPDLANLVAMSIKNRKDYWTWMRVLALPANGWFTTEIPVPRPDMTCDRVTDHVSLDIPLTFSLTPCRATAGQMAEFFDTILAVDATVRDEPELLTVYVVAILQSVERAPLEYRKLFMGAGPTRTAGIDRSLLIEDAHAALPAYILRAFAIAIKQSIRKASGGAPANLVALMQNGTTSRFDAAEILGAIAYLTSRLDGSEICGGCKTLEEQVSETVVQDMATWFAGVGLAARGEIAEADIDRRVCTLAGNAHGKANELVMTAAYHSLYEFGGLVGVSNPGRYQILLSDPRKGDDILNVAVMESDGKDKEHYEASPYQRKPDLVLVGDGPGKRIWVETKSWRYNDAYLAKGELTEQRFKGWDGKLNSKGYTTAAHRQHFLDEAATKDALLKEFWQKKPFFGKAPEPWKPSSHVTWFQVWKAGKRSWYPLEKTSGGRYRLGKNKISLNVSTPWISEDGVVTTTTSQFKALQRFMTQAPTRISEDAFRTTMGYAKAEHDERYAKRQVGSNFSEIARSTIRPFNLRTFYAIELGAANGARAMNLIQEQIGAGEFAELRKLVNNGEVSAEKIAEAQELIIKKIEAMLGPISYLLVDIPGVSWVENKTADWLLGDEVEALRKATAEMEVPFADSVFENACETP